MVALSWKTLSKQQRKDTEPWIRNKADELAVNNGCWFDPVKAAYMIWWVERHCVLYEGEFAGEPVIMHSIVDQPAEWKLIPQEYRLFVNANGDPIPRVLDFYQERIKWHNDLFHSGQFMDWHFECHARIYGWQRVAAERWQKRGRYAVRRFRRGRVWIAKKNKKSPSLAFNTLYLTCGDGESGGKTFILAKDGTQAVKTWDHARIMQEESQELLSQTKVNLNTHRITHLPTRSYTEPLSSSNVRTKDSKHGINGNVIVDEGHVVDRDLMKIVEDAGASRSQALELMFSTVGNNPESWGKSQWDLGESINDGKVADDSFFHQSYHAPQDLTARQAKKNPEKFIRMANPALGHTVGLEEMLPRFWTCVDNPAEWANYAMLRLMIWQRSSVGWLPPDAWPKCGGHQFDDDDLKKRPCVLGLDLAQKRDLAACVPSWRNELDGVDISKPMFWCCQERIDEIAVKFPGIQDFVDEGHIRVNEGDVTDMRIIKNDIRQFCLEHNVIGIVYDAKYAEWLIQQIVDGELDPAGNVLVEGLPIEEQAISQGIMTQTGPVVDFENSVRSKATRHDDNPVLGWQFGHATVYTDRQGNRRIQKEDRHSFRTVDGCQASVMARWGAVDFSKWTVDVRNFYENNEVELV